VAQAIAGAQPRQASDRPDVFLITIDTLRADHVHCYGDLNIQTPALDALAKDGIRFAHAFTPSPITNSSHTTILTGLLPSSHGVTDFAIPLAPDHATWAQLLKDGAGYHTAAFIGAVILDSRSLSPSLDRGFDYYDNFPEHPSTTSRWGRVERRGMDVVGRAEHWLDSHPSGPHFVWVHLYDPHDPYEPPPPYSQIYKDRLYDGEIAYADSALANFLDYLKSRGWYRNAIVVVAGDHGEGLGEHGENTHGIFLYDATTHVPLIAKLPHGIAAGKLVDAQVRTTDILPTVLDLLGMAVPAKLDGKSLTPYFLGDASDRVAIGETDYPARFGWAPLRSVRTQDFKLIEAPRPELYDLEKDPSELMNLYAGGHAVADKLGAILADSPAKMRPSPLPDPKDKIQEANLLHTAMLASEDNRPHDARATLEEVLKLDPKSSTALRSLGELELNAGDYSAAARHFEQAREARPDDATTWLREGEARVKMGDFEGARAAFESSLKLSAGQLEARLLLGDVYLQLKNPDAAEDQFEAASLLDPNSIPAQLGRARALMAQGKTGEAIQQLTPLTLSNPKAPETYDLLAQAYRSAGKTREAEKAEAQARLLRQKHSE
jgi:arylsulfatase A-like enzyme/Flp pilus assembly protein TadD